MKKQLMFRVAVMCVSATIALTAISCNDDDDNVANEIAFDGTKKSINQVLFSSSSHKQEHSDGSSYYQQGLIVVTDELDLEGEFDFPTTGDAIFIDFNGPNKTLETGTYTYTFRRGN